MVNLKKERIEEIISNIKGKNIAVLGDVMLDRYYWGSVSRVSPEAPVPVVDVIKETYHLGGAANVAKNLKTLGANPVLCGVVGNDIEGVTFREIASKIGINTDGLFIAPDRPTTVKTRILGNNQHIVRLDKEIRDEISSQAEKFIIKFLDEFKGISGLVIEDYNKGTLSSILIREVISAAREHRIPILVDPKFNNFFAFKGVTVFKPNKKEAMQALGIEFRTEEDIISAGKSLLKKLNCQNVLITLGESGMMLFESDGNYNSVPTFARRVADVSGAGDTAIATMAATYSGGANIREAASMANYAAGFVCEKPGIIAIESGELRELLLKNSD